MNHPICRLEFRLSEAARRVAACRWLVVCLLSLAVVSCHSGVANFPWGDAPQRPEPPHADVRELTADYRRTSSQVWVREVIRPTRAALDYAAYHANFMIADPEPETPFVSGASPQTASPFAQALDPATLTGDFGKVPLTPTERAQPLAFAPLSEFLQAHKVEGAAALADVGAAVRDETWGLRLPPGSSGQTLSELYLHATSAGAELWAKVEFQPWFKAFAKSPDQDGDGFPELYGRVRGAVASTELVNAIRHQYMEPVLTPAEVKAWANQLSSYWYPSFNTDLIPPGATFPDALTESNIAQELGGRSFSNPSIVLRGKPQGKPTYNVFLLHGASSASGTPAPASTLELKKTKPTPNPAPVAARVAEELTRVGDGSWEKWEAELAPFRSAVRKRLKAVPPKVKAFSGDDGYLFYRNSMVYVAGGDLENQPKGKNPLPIIVAFKKLLDRQGVDFLFVPVPTKEELYPEKLDPHFAALSGQIVNPSFRRFVAHLAEHGVEVIDLLPPLLAAKRAAAAEPEPLFQHQDTHWTSRGLELAADSIAARVKLYPWYAELSRHAQHFTERQTTFTRFGDLQSRLPDAEQKKYVPEVLVAHQILRADKTPYEDDPDSPIVMLGDSFTGVYELTDAEHAGVSAHVARRISYPLDLVMSYGGGPNVREKLLRGGGPLLSTKKLVIWMMTSRDLFNYWEDWAPLKEQ